MRFGLRCFSAEAAAFITSVLKPRVSLPPRPATRAGPDAVDQDKLHTATERLVQGIPRLRPQIKREVLDVDHAFAGGRTQEAIVLDRHQTTVEQQTHRPVEVVTIELNVVRNAPMSQSRRCRFGGLA